MAVQILPPILRTPGAQDDYPFFLLKPDGSARDITNDFIEVFVGDDIEHSLLAVSSANAAAVEKDDPTNGGWTLHIGPDFVHDAAEKVIRYQVRVTPSATAPGAASVVVGEGVFTITAALFKLPDFTITPTNSALSLVAGVNDSQNVVVSSNNAYAGTVTLSVVVSPVVVNGPTASIGTPAAVPSGGSVTKLLDIGTVVATPLGSYVVTITGVDGLLTRTATVALTVT